MENKEINLEVIENQYRNKGAAIKAYRNLQKLIKSDKKNELESLLRNHFEKEILSDEEINKRDDIDFLLDFYSILEIALIAGYIPDQLPTKLTNEINFLLSNEFLNKYFSQYYPILLPQLLLKQVRISNSIIIINNETSITSYSLFERFLMLRQYLKEDSDIDQFLWFLDDGWTQDYSINDFWNVLENQKLIQYKLGRLNSHPLNKALWGFIKYIQFLTEYATLLRDSKDNILLQSAFWHHQSYWFKNMGSRIGDIVDVGINNIRRSINNVNSSNLNKDLLNGDQDAILFNEIEKDINYLLNETLGNPILSYYENY